jgi:hypothetical protein
MNKRSVLLSNFFSSLNKVNMTKKPLIACLAMLVLLVLAKLFFYNNANNAVGANTFAQIQEPYDPYLSTLNFASEAVPVADAHVSFRVQKILKSYRYRRLRSHRLHYQAKNIFPIMEPILVAYGIPQDFKYIPLVESGFKSGTSHKGASGAWQFMPQTARSFGLKVNSAIDERQQLAKSTVAACKYLRSLYKEFNNWTLVAAAYNIGENKLKRIICRQDHANYFSLKLNPETASYVYKLVAMKEIIENPTRYGYRRIEMPQKSSTIFTQQARYSPENFLMGVVLKQALID